jgi:GxxExxY protein
VPHTFEALSYVIWGACIEVQKQLGPHCMEVDYQRALELALGKRGLEFVREAEIPIYFDGQEITRRRVDFAIWDATDTVLLEVKAARAIRDEDIEQCVLYLRQGGFRVCLLANFGQVPLGKQRLVHRPDRPALYGPGGRGAPEAV